MFCSCFLKDYSHIKALAIIILAGKVNSKFCNGGHFCSPPKECCPLGCCLVFASPGYRPTITQTSPSSSSMPNFLLWNHWMFWLLLIFLLFIFVCGCGLWKKRQFFANRICRQSSRNEEERSEQDSAGSCYPPPQYSRCSSFHFAPPPYTEVTSKPDLYPLVISYRSDTGKLSDNCLMVQYYRNYVVHPALGSLSAGSTVDSISSSYFNQSVHEIDSSFPPTYDESRNEGRNSFERESITSTNHIRSQQEQFLSQAQIVKNINCENVLENRSGVQSNEIQQAVIENIHQSIQKASTRVLDMSKLKSNLPETFKNVKTLRNAAQSLPNNLYSEPTTNTKKLFRPSNLYLDTFKRINKSIIISTSADSIHENDSLTHQYSSDVILAQPRSYCESNGELHYYSSDILNYTNNFLHCANDSYSSEDNLSQPRGSLQDFVSSDGLSHSQFSNLEINNFSTSSDVSSLHGCGSPDSPPQATSPTGEFRNLLDKIQKLPIHRDTNKAFDFFNTQTDNPDSEESPSVQKLEIPPLENGELSENELVEKSLLLNERAELKDKKIEVIRPNKLLYKQNFPSRSKTFYMPFYHNSLSLKRKNKSKSSTSAPATPVINFPSPNSTTLTFVMNSGNKHGSKKSLENKGDDTPLLYDEDENVDEIF